MGRRTTRKPRRNEVNRPSMFFLIALAIGLILLIFVAVMIIRHPPAQGGPLGGVRTSPALFARPSPTEA